MERERQIRICLLFSINRHFRIFVSFKSIILRGKVGLYKQGGFNQMNTDKTYAEKIASEYAPKETRKIVALKKLDGRAKRPANIFAFTFGIVMTLLLGIGMCLSMNVIGNGSTVHKVLGIIAGTIGIIGISVNYPIFKRILKKSMNKYAADILDLAGQITEE